MAAAYPILPSSNRQGHGLSCLGPGFRVQGFRVQGFRANAWSPRALDPGQARHTHARLAPHLCCTISGCPPPLAARCHPPLQVGRTGPRCGRRPTCLPSSARSVGPALSRTINLCVCCCLFLPAVCLCRVFPACYLCAVFLACYLCCCCPCFLALYLCAVFVPRCLQFCSSFCHPPASPGPGLARRPAPHCTTSCFLVLLCQQQTGSFLIFCPPPPPHPPTHPPTMRCRYSLTWGKSSPRSQPWRGEEGGDWFQGGQLGRVPPRGDL